MATPSTSKRSSRASSSSSKAPTPKSKPAPTRKASGSASRGKGTKKKKEVIVLSSDDDDQEISSSDIDGSDFEESRNKEREKKRKLQEKEGGKPNKKSRKGAEEEESHDEEEDEEEDASDASAEVSEIEEDDEEEENVVSKGKGKPFKSKDGTTVVRQVVKAPTTGLVPAGQVSKNTLGFLEDLTKPGHNDREWFWANEPRYRMAEKEWNAFVDTLVPKIMEIDDEIPYMPSKDLVHRIYRDVRFSNDKTPYKKNLSASLSRTGRKGGFAHYHVMIMPNGRSILAAGVWGPDKDQLASIRAFILNSPKRLRKILSAPEFVAEFGEPKPFADAKKKPKKKKKAADSSDEDEEEAEDHDAPSARRRRSVFGGEDALKVAPKGISKDHPDIDLLKLRSVAVIKQFKDNDVTSPGWQDELLRVIKIVQPFVHLLNEMVTPAEAEEEEEGDGEGEEGGEAEDDEE
ncbi:hypothetical protein BDY24DRAFT_444228 [Mrakia frigida]|uniref:DUF2461 domain-containing protein n=1 Tax=Mrakia frigida TaxID=29902 RepID=UPI003FCC1A1A